jgi:hypothetical protein
MNSFYAQRDLHHINALVVASITNHQTTWYTKTAHDGESLDKPIVDSQNKRKTAIEEKNNKIKRKQRWQLREQSRKKNIEEKSVL